MASSTPPRLTSLIWITGATQRPFHITLSAGLGLVIHRFSGPSRSLRITAALRTESLSIGRRELKPREKSALSSLMLLTLRLLYWRQSACRFLRALTERRRDLSTERRWFIRSTIPKLKKHIRLSILRCLETAEFITMAGWHARVIPFPG